MGRIPSNWEQRCKKWIDCGLYTAHNNRCNHGNYESCALFVGKGSKGIFKHVIDIQQEQILDLQQKIHNIWNVILERDNGASKTTETKD